MKKCITGLATAAIAGSATLASAMPVTFQAFENSDSLNLTGLDLTVALIDQGSQVDFVFSNSSAIASVVTSLYIETTGTTSSMLSDATIVDSNGPVFSFGATPPTPPGSITQVGGAWAGNLVSLDANSPGTRNGINPGEFLTVRFDLAGSFTDLQNDFLSQGGFRIVQHVQSVNNAGSIWTLNTVPGPAGVAVLGLAGLTATRRRR